MTEEFKVAPDHIVAIDYKLLLDDGEIVDSTEGDEPLIYLHGHDQIVPGLERALEGKAPGESDHIRVPPEDGYGVYDPSKIFKEAPDRFGFAVEVGMVVQGQLDDGQHFPIKVLAVDEDAVTLDGNHPLAGKTLDFQITVLAVRPATQEEIDHGHAHDGGCGHGHDHGHGGCCGHDHGDEDE